MEEICKLFPGRIKHKDSTVNYNTSRKNKLMKCCEIRKDN
jgi:hypothetical protein